MAFVCINYPIHGIPNYTPKLQGKRFWLSIPLCPNHINIKHLCHILMILETRRTKHSCEQCRLCQDATNSSFQLIFHTLSSRLSWRRLMWGPHFPCKRHGPHLQWKNTYDVKPTPPTPSNNSSYYHYYYYYNLAKMNEWRATSPTQLSSQKYFMEDLHILVTRILRPTCGNCNEKPTAKMRGFLVPFTDIIGGTRRECIGKIIVVVATFNHKLLLSTGAPRQ